jgi:hypothetical protein
MQKSNKSRRFSGTSRNRPDRKKQRQLEATGTEPGKEGRNTLYSQLTVQQKLDRLPPAPLCAKQRAKLMAQLEGKKPVVKTSITQEVAVQMAKDCQNQEGDVDAIASRPTGKPIKTEEQTK